MSFFRSDGKFIYLDAPSAEFYLPMYYFEAKQDGFAYDYGQTIHTLGFFQIAIIKDGKKEYHIMNIPTWIDIFTYDSVEETLQLPHDDSPQKYRVLTYLNGQKICNKSTIIDTTNIEVFFGYILEGNLPPIIREEDSINLWLKNIELNGAKLGIPSTDMEMILSVLYRYKKNPKITYAVASANGVTNDEYDYVMNRIRQVCQYASTYSGLTFEDFDTMVSTSLNRTRNKDPEAYSPVEKIIKM